MSDQHTIFEELCMMAAAQQLSPFDRRRLDEHLSLCDRCSDYYLDMAMLAGAIATPDTLVGAASGDGLRTAKNLMIVQPVHGPGVEERGAVAGDRSRNRLWWMTAAAGVACFGFGLGTARYIGTKSGPGEQRQIAAVGVAAARTAPVAETPVVQPPAPQQQPTQLTATVSPDAGLKAELERLRTELEASQAELGALQQQRLQTAQAGQEQAAELAKLRLENSTQQALISQVQLQLDQSHTALAQDAKLVALRDDQLRQLTTNVVTNASEVAEDRRLTDASRLMGQRNLHVVDVYDTNTKGQRAPSFGRVFYSEGGPMMFVAFDLPGNGAAGKTTYHAWGQTEGSSRKPLQLGTFTQDDAQSQRWVMRVSDAKLLKQVDAVFVTADHGAEVHAPSGVPMLYAYLRQVPNHP